MLTHTHTNKQSTRPKYPPRPTRALSAGAVTRKRSSRDQRSAAPLRPAQKTPGESVYSLTVHVAVCCVCLQLIVCLSFDLFAVDERFFGRLGNNSITRSKVVRLVNLIGCTYMCNVDAHGCTSMCNVDARGCAYMHL